jgi:hypothetical protein
MTGPQAEADAMAEEKFPNIARVQRLAFLFRRDIAKALQRDEGQVLAGMIYGAISGGVNVEYCIDSLMMRFHPDKQQRRDACQRILDDLEFRFDSDIRKLEFKGDFLSAALMRKDIERTRAVFEQEVGKLAHRETIDDSATS